MLVASNFNFVVDRGYSYVFSHEYFNRYSAVQLTFFLIKELKLNVSLVKSNNKLFVCCKDSDTVIRLSSIVSFLSSGV